MTLLIGITIGIAVAVGSGWLAWRRFVKDYTT